MQAKGIWKQDPEVNIGAKRDENGEWRRLHNEKHHWLYPNIVRVISNIRLTCAGDVSKMEEIGGALKILTGKGSKTLE